MIGFLVGEREHFVGEGKCGRSRNGLDAALVASFITSYDCEDCRSRLFGG